MQIGAETCLRKHVIVYLKLIFISGLSNNRDTDTFILVLVCYGKSCKQKQQCLQWLYVEVKDYLMSYQKMRFEYLISRLFLRDDFFAILWAISIDP